MQIKSRLFLFLFLFSFKSFAYLGPCEGLYEVPATEEATFDVSTRHKGLTPKQIKVLFFIVLAKEDSEMRNWVQLSPNAIREHVKMLYRKFKVKNRNALAAYAVHKSLVDPELGMKTNGYTEGYLGGEFRNFDRELSREVWGPLSPFNGDINEFSSLTGNERIALLYSLLGYSHKEIARELNRSIYWVDDYIPTIKIKLLVKTVGAAGVKAMRLKFFGDITDELFTGYPSVETIKSIVQKSLETYPYVKPNVEF